MATTTKHVIFVKHVRGRKGTYVREGDLNTTVRKNATRYPSIKAAQWAADQMNENGRGWRYEVREVEVPA